MIADALDPANVTGLSVGAVLLGLVFRTLWKQEGGWRAVLAATQADAATARTEAAAARADAAAARSDARLARNSEQECRRRLSALEQQQRHTTLRLNSLDSGDTPTALEET